ncbi:MAG TPA: roadblock/LC7 domain-containing protein [Thermomicrobiales bacterium]|nr:roadblock/LC7 domain-containing protein [Thermomicrobiales bacterium]
MNQLLMELLEYRVVLGALVTTMDGLVIAHAGLNPEDTELLAAASSSQTGDDLYVSANTRGGTMHVLRGQDMRLVVLTDSALPREPVVAMMSRQLAALEEAIAV